MATTDMALIGTWRLVSCFLEDVETKEQKLLWGEQPNAYIILTLEGRWVVLEIPENREAAAQTDEYRATAFRLMLAHSGWYRTDGNKIVIKIDIAWDNRGRTQNRFATTG